MILKEAVSSVFVMVIISGLETTEVEPWENIVKCLQVN